MMKCNENYAIDMATKLAKANIESTNTWFSPKAVNEFIQEVYSMLVGEEESGD